MRAGTLRRRAQLQAPVDDGHGGYSLGWSTQITMWAELIQPIGPDMPLAEDTDVTHQVNLRYYAAVREGMLTVAYITPAGEPMYELTPLGMARALAALETVTERPAELTPAHMVALAAGLHEVPR